MFKKKLLVDQDIKVLGKSVFIDDGKFKADLKVLGVGKMKDKLIVDGLTKMNGDAKVFGDFKINSLANTILTTNRLMAINPNGKLIISSLKLAVDDMYVCSSANIAPWVGANGTTTDDDILLCPNYKSVTIGGDFTVSGLTFLKTTGIGIAPNNQNQLNMRSVGKEAGIQLFTVPFSSTTTAKYAFKNIVTNDDINAYSVSQGTTTNSQDVFVVKGDGRVGIKTDTPEDRLHVGNGHTKLVVGSAFGQDLGFGTSYLGFNASRQNGSTWSTAGDNAHDGGAVIYSDIFGSIRFSTIPYTGATGQTGISDATIASNTRLFIHRDGNIGIGTVAINGFKLSVEGQIRARGIRVDATNITWFDYVFTKDYELASLAEVEKYVNKYQHLPNVPSEKEVKEQGINLGEMDAILLRKIEELTLYMIDLKKENELLQLKVKQLEEVH